MHPFHRMKSMLLKASTIYKPKIDIIQCRPRPVQRNDKILLTLITINYFCLKSENKNDNKHEIMAFVLLL